eukprot:239740-Amphidinium_carterae.1
MLGPYLSCEDSEAGKISRRLGKAQLEETTLECHREDASFTHVHHSNSCKQLTLFRNRGSTPRPSPIPSSSTPPKKIDYFAVMSVRFLENALGKPWDFGWGGGRSNQERMKPDPLHYKIFFFRCMFSSL